MKVGMSSRSSRSARCNSGCVARMVTAVPSSEAVDSPPALNKEIRIIWAVKRSSCPSAHTVASTLIRSSRGSGFRSVEVFDDIGVEFTE